ncbi:hypothetical protein LY76DRAFT_212899 [Colletotrichum caudatum]|nr:hypothetical protein LY76DRAFT_212899 [Colletotrichum caudatum]
MELACFPHPLRVFLYRILLVNKSLAILCPRLGRQFTEVGLQGSPSQGRTCTRFRQFTATTFTSVFSCISVILFCDPGTWPASDPGHMTSRCHWNRRSVLHKKPTRRDHLCRYLLQGVWSNATVPSNQL